MPWQRRLLASLPLAAAALWLTTASASAQALGVPNGAPQAPTNAPKVDSVKQAAQPAVQAAQPAAHAAKGAQQTATKAAQPVTHTVDQATKQANAAVTAVSRSVEQTVQTAVAAAPAPVPSPPSLPAAPQIPALSPVLDTVTEVVTQVVTPIDAVVDEAEQPEADSAPPPFAQPVVRAEISLPVAAQPAVAPPLPRVVAEPNTEAVVTDIPADEETPSALEVSSDINVIPTTERFTEINAIAAFPQPALVAQAPVIDAPAKDVLQPANVDSFEPLVPGGTSYYVLPASDPTTPVTTKLPASIGLPNSAAAGQVPSLTPLTAPDTVRGVWPNAGRLPSVIVLPNLAPPG